eukprot:4079657-Alexandrium_andersonii.AAC.1
MAALVHAWRSGMCICLAVVVVHCVHVNLCLLSLPIPPLFPPCPVCVLLQAVGSPRLFNHTPLHRL